LDQNRVAFKDKMWAVANRQPQCHNPVMPIDEHSLESGTPRTLDGRSYPNHLRRYEQYDQTFLELAASFPATFTFDDLAAVASTTTRVRDAFPRWLASAEWRQLLHRADDVPSTPRAYVLTPRGVDVLRQLRLSSAA
jgi:hypothetical protein